MSVLSAPTTANTTYALEQMAPFIGRWRRMLGLIMLASVILLWTASNFLVSDVLADGSYSKPFLVTYINSCAFALLLLPVLGWQTLQGSLAEEDLSWAAWKRGLGIGGVAQEGAVPGYPSAAATATAHLRKSSTAGRPRRNSSPAEAEHLLAQPYDEEAPNGLLSAPSGRRKQRLGLIATFHLSLTFAPLWFLANYFVTACLSYTTVASSTILTSTSSLFTLAIGYRAGVERVTVAKAAGVVASFAGVVLIALADASGTNTDAAHRGDFPAKTRAEVLYGDAIALLSAALYGVYSVVMKKRMGDGAGVDMPLFFACVGLLNVCLAWPAFALLHYARLEPLQLPPDSHVVAVLLANSLTSLASDLAWALAVLLTSPIIVSVGLSLMIPLSLVGQVVIHGQTTGWVYWLGAAVVVGSFVFINREEKKEDMGGKGALAGEGDLND